MIEHRKTCAIDTFVQHQQILKNKKKIIPRVLKTYYKRNIVISRFSFTWRPSRSEKSELFSIHNSFRTSMMTNGFKRMNAAGVKEDNIQPVLQTDTTQSERTSTNNKIISISTTTKVSSTFNQKGNDSKILFPYYTKNIRIK